MKPRSIIDLENTITKKENNYFKEKIIKQEEDYNKTVIFTVMVSYYSFKRTDMDNIL